MDFIETDKAPPAAGHYSQAVVANGFIFTAVTLPIDPGGVDIKGSIKDQAKQVLENIEVVVEAAGGQKNTIAKMTIYVSDVTFWDDINQVYTAFFKDHKPARGVIETSNIRKGYGVAMEAVATVVS